MRCIISKIPFVYFIASEYEQSYQERHFFQTYHLISLRSSHQQLCLDVIGQVCLQPLSNSANRTVPLVRFF
jgi:hypothetical protein